MEEFSRRLQVLSMCLDEMAQENIALLKKLAMLSGMYLLGGYVCFFVIHVFVYLCAVRVCVRAFCYLCSACVSIRWLRKTPRC